MEVQCIAFKNIGYDVDYVAQEKAKRDSCLKPNNLIAENKEYIKVDPADFSPLFANGDFACQCCFSNFPFETLIKCSKASDKNTHVFCEDCIKGYIEAGLSDGKANIKCMMNTNDKCGGEYQIEVIKNCIGGKQFDMLQDQLLVSDNIKISQILDDYQICPSCLKYGCIADDTIQYIKCNRCDKFWCSQCKLEYHGDDVCGKINKINTDAIRRVIAETLTNSLTHRCPQCATKYIKENGCNQIYCNSCRRYSCYVCHTLINGSYEHFARSPYNYAVYDGSKCQLWNDDDGESSYGNTAGTGNEQYNNTRMIKLCSNILKVNSKEVRHVMLEEMKKLNVPIDKLEIELINDPENESVIIEPLVEQIVESLVGPVAAPIVEPAVEPIVEPAVEPIAEPIVAPIVEPIVGQIAEPIVEQIVEPLVEQIVGPIVELMVGQIAEPIVELIVGQIAEPLVEPLAEPLVEPNEIINLKVPAKSNNKRRYKKKNKSKKIIESEPAKIKYTIRWIDKNGKLRYTTRWAPLINKFNLLI